MNYKTYAKALFESFLGKNESEFSNFFDNFIKSLKDKDRISILPKILKEVEKYFKIAEKKDFTEVVLRDKKDFDKFQEEFKKVSDKFNLDDVKIVENKNIVGGFILRNGKNILNKSYKNGLLKLYKKITK